MLVLAKPSLNQRSEALLLFCIFLVSGPDLHDGIFQLDFEHAHSEVSFIFLGIRSIVMKDIIER